MARTQSIKHHITFAPAVDCLTDTLCDDFKMNRSTVVDVAIRALAKTYGSTGEIPARTSIGTDVQRIRLLCEQISAYAEDCEPNAALYIQLRIESLWGRLTENAYQEAIQSIE
ncbi:hypothetical protein [Streptomyces sp. AcH 505]|uniref:hypothetical protein n=1 Tax=Streptomyces sp. AcH 505 TaxID=352211 RepID=UPI0006935F31